MRADAFGRRPESFQHRDLTQAVCGEVDEGADLCGGPAALDVDEMDRQRFGLVIGEHRLQGSALQIGPDLVGQHPAQPQPLRTMAIEAATLLTVRRGSTLTIRVPFGPNRYALAGPSGMVATRRWRARSAGSCGIPCSAK